MKNAATSNKSLICVVNVRAAKVEFNRFFGDRTEEILQNVDNTYAHPFQSLLQHYSPISEGTSLKQSFLLCSWI